MPRIKGVDTCLFYKGLLSFGIFPACLMIHCAVKFCDNSWSHYICLPLNVWVKQLTQRHQRKFSGHSATRTTSFSKLSHQPEVWSDLILNRWRWCGWALDYRFRKICFQFLKLGLCVVICPKHIEKAAFSKIPVFLWTRSQRQMLYYYF